jgi:hypothetical protein
LILTRLRQLGQLKLQPRELLAALRELALQYKAYLSGNAVKARWITAPRTDASYLDAHKGRGARAPRHWPAHAGIKPVSGGR